MNQLRLQPVGSGICQLLTEDGLHVGNFKLIGGIWKFKAIGYDAAGQVVPGGGPLTKKHNTVISHLDADKVNQALS